MKRNLWIPLALAGLSQAAFAHTTSFQAAPAKTVLVVPTVNLPVKPTILPGTPTLPTRNIPGPFEQGKPVIKLPTIERIEPRLPFPIHVLPAGAKAYPMKLAQAGQSEKGITEQDLDATYDNGAVRVTDDGVVVVVDDRRKKEKRRASHMTLPESDLRLEIGILE